MQNVAICMHHSNSLSLMLYIFPVVYLMPILLIGNDCLFEYNYIANLCYEVTDSGAFYSGHSWIDRGNIVRHSHFENIRMTENTILGAKVVKGIYLDDQVSLYYDVVITSSK